MTKTATVSWELPTVRESGLPLDPENIQGVEVALAIVGASFTVLDTVSPDTLEHLVPDLEPGDWAFQLVVVDTDDRRGMEVAVPFTVPDESPPGIVTNPNIVLS